jgi:micrococcal nuclease
MKLTRRFFLAAGAVAAVAPAPLLAAAPDSLPDGGTGKVGLVHDGDTVRFVGGEVDIRLVGLQAPKVPQGRKRPVAWPLAEHSRSALQALVRDHTITARLAPTPRDRNGRTLAHLVRDDGLWIQERMLQEGWARVYTFADNRIFARELYAAETAARTARRGMWAEAFYAVRAPDPATLKADIGTFQIVEGWVADAARVRGRVYLNFGEDYRTDFTVSIAPDVMPLFSAAKFDPLSLKARAVRVRGYLRDFNGPLIDLTHPEQIEII